MAPDATDSIDFAPMAPEVASPSMAVDESNVVPCKTIVSEVQELIIPTETITETAPPVMAAGDPKMVLDNTISSAKQEAILAEDTIDMAPHARVADDSNTVVFKTFASEAQELVAQIETTTDMSLPSLNTEAPTIVSEHFEISLPQIGEQPVSETTLDLDSLCIPAINANITARETIPLRTQELAASVEAAPDEAQPSSIDGVPFVVSESIEMRSPEVQEQPDLAEAVPDMSFLYMTTADVDAIFEAFEVGSTSIPEAEFSLGSALDMATAIAANEPSELIELGSPEIQQQNISGLDAPSLAVINKETVLKPLETTATQIPLLVCSAEDNLDVKSAMASGASVMVSESIEMNLSEFQEQPKTTSDVGFLCKPGRDTNIFFGSIGTNSAEVKDPVFSAEATSDTKAPSLTINIPVLLSEGNEIFSQLGSQEAPISSKGTPDVNSPCVPFGNKQMLFESIETSSRDMPEPTFSTEVTTSSSLADYMPIMPPEPIEVSFAEMQKVSIPTEVVPNTTFPPRELWDQENTLIASRKSGEKEFSWGNRGQVDAGFKMNIDEDALEMFESKKRKLSKDQDEFAGESPRSKRNAIPSSRRATVLDGWTGPMSPPFNGSNMISEPDETCSAVPSEVSVSVNLPPPLSMDLEFTDSEITQTSPPISADVGQPQFKKNLANETIQLHIGPKNKCVLAHKYILNKSPFFASVFRRHPFHEQTSQVYQFPTFDVYAFARIVHWLYCGNIRSVAKDYKKNDVFDTAHMVKVYCLCYKLELRSLMNLAIELLGHGYLKNHSAPTIEDIDFAYNQTGRWSGLRIYMASWVRCRQHAPAQKCFMAAPWELQDFRTLAAKHPDLLKDLQKLCGCNDPAYSKSLDPRYHNICWYHNHPNGEQCGIAGRTFENIHK